MSGSEESNSNNNRDKRSFRHSLLRVGSDKYLTNRKTVKGKIQVYLIQSSIKFDPQTQPSSL